jgi:hypothetical protein
MKTATLTILTLLFSVTDIFGQASKDSLIVFVGEIIEVKYSPEKRKAVDTIIEGKDTFYVISTSMDSRYVAKYKILQLLQGAYKADTIEFVAFDHYGSRAFQNTRRCFYLSPKVIVNFIMKNINTSACI